MHFMKSLLLLVSLHACLASLGQQGAYREKYRPQFHFTPPKNWMNDPNGLIYFNGQYHMFYQYNPFGNKWGHMSWGHAISRDLVRWKNLPVAIPEDRNNMIFSGSCVADVKNTTGFANRRGQVPLVAVYTAHIIPDSTHPDDYLQNQHIACSTDEGKTWTKYASNPVLDIQKKDFRDPKAFWHEPSAKWIMALVLPKQHIAQLYSSNNLKQWTHLSDFGPAGDTADIWECQDLLQVPVEGELGKSKWVLINSQQTAMQYFVGEFDGVKFVNENPAGIILRPDYGPDYYAGITYNNLPHGQSPVLVGWANNWSYAQSIPTNPWRSAMAIPRTLSLKKDGNMWLLLEKPIAALSTLRGMLVQWQNVAVNARKKLSAAGQQFEMKVVFTPSPSTAGVNVAVGDHKKFVIGYNGTAHTLFIDRSQSGDTGFDPQFVKWLRSEVNLEPVNGKITLDIFFDHSLVEVYANDGRVVMTAQIFPGESQNGVELFSEGGAIKFDSVRFWPMRSAWQ